MQDSETSELLSRIKSQFDFFSEAEIFEFIRTHPWLETETDSSILLDYLLSYSKGLSEHYTQQYTRLCQIKEEIASLNPTLKKLKKDTEICEKPEIFNKNKNEEFKEKISEKSREISEIPSEDSLLLSLIAKFDEMLAFFKESGAESESEKHFSLIYSVLWKILEFPKNPNFREILISPEEFLLSSYLIEIFEILGFVSCEIDGKINLIYAEDRFPFFENAMQFISSEYCPNVKKSLKNHVNPDKTSERERVEAQMSFLDRKRERPVISQQEMSVHDQLKEYRDKMRQKIQQTRPFSSRNIMNMSNFTTNQENSSFNSSNLPGFTNRIVTMDDIEKKTIVENIAIFAKKALFFTNEFRKKQGKASVEWNQNLCDIGMKHSKDMADQKVPFGHQGFNQRAASVAFQHGGVYENVAYCQGIDDVPKVNFFAFFGIFTIFIKKDDCRWVD